jgi:hypothetical protein
VIASEDNNTPRLSAVPLPMPPLPADLGQTERGIDRKKRPAIPSVTSHVTSTPAVSDTAPTTISSSSRSNNSSPRRTQSAGRVKGAVVGSGLGPPPRQENNRYNHYIDRDNDGIERKEDGGYLLAHMQMKDPIPNRQMSQDLGKEDQEDQSTVRSKLTAVSTASAQTQQTNQTSGSRRASSTGHPGRPIPGGQELPSRPVKMLSNLQQVKNAINHVCLAGAHFDLQRGEAIRVVELSASGEQSGTAEEDPYSVTQFILLFYHSKRLCFRGVYSVHPFSHEIKRVFGRGPKVLLSSYVEEYFKYESSSRSFRPILTKDLTSTTDAVSVDPSKMKKLLVSN